MAQSSGGHAVLAIPAPRQPLSMLSAEQVAQLLWLIRAADSVQLKLSVSDVGKRAAVTALGIDPLDARIRQVTFFDTPDLTLYHHGVVVRSRHAPHNPGELTVRLRRVAPDRLPAGLRRSPNFGVEIDAMPGGYLCSASVKSVVDHGALEETLAGRRPLRTLLTGEQHEFLSVNAPDGVLLNGLAPFGPVTILKLKSARAGFGRRMLAEVWDYAYGPRILELSAKCDPAEAFDLAAETTAFLSAQGIDLLAEQRRFDPYGAGVVRKPFANAGHPPITHTKLEA